MRFVTYLDDDQNRVGAVAADRVHPLPAGVAMLELLRAGTLRQVGERALVASAGRPLADLRLRAPIPDPPTVRDFMTFEQHVEGVAQLAGDGAQVPERNRGATAPPTTSR